MPPTGWTGRDVAHRDAIAKALEGKGFSNAQAHAIATSQKIKSLKRVVQDG